MSGPVPDPMDATFSGWVRRVSIAFPDENFPDPGRESDWREWARMLYTMPAFVNILMPDPLFHADWREWAAGLRVAADAIGAE